MPPIGTLLLVSLTMIFGSFVAGFTALGGGAVSFPVMTKLLGYSVHDARQFGVMIQSVGMTSASIYLLRAQGLGLLDTTLKTYLAGSVIGATVSFFALTIPADFVKLTFSVFIFSFAFSNLFNISLRLTTNQFVIFGAGLLGGALSQNLGTGADGLFYMVLVLIFGSQIKRALWQSIVIMAATSLYIATLTLIADEVSSLVIWSWVFAAPVVIFGAAFGAFMTRRVNETVLKYSLFVLTAVELSWTLFLRAGWV